MSYWRCKRPDHNAVTKGGGLCPCGRDVLVDDRPTVFVTRGERFDGARIGDHVPNPDHGREVAVCRWCNRVRVVEDDTNELCGACADWREDLRSDALGDDDRDRYDDDLEPAEDR